MAESSRLTRLDYVFLSVNPKYTESSSILVYIPAEHIFGQLTITVTGILSSGTKKTWVEETADGLITSAHASFLSLLLPTLQTMVQQVALTSRF